MKVFIIGTNLGKYTMLKKIIDHLTKSYDAECEVVDWLTKKNLNPELYSTGDFYIYVEVEKLFDSGIYIRIEPGETSKAIALKFAEANAFLKSMNDDCIKEEAVDDSPPFDMNENVLEIVNANSIIAQEPELICIKKYTGKKSSVTGITVTINGEDHYISKEDFQELYELDKLLEKNNMVLKEIVVE
jgi:hypothetical protein